MLDFFHMKLNLGNLFISVKKANVYPASKYTAIQNALDQIIYDKPTLFFIKDD